MHAFTRVECRACFQVDAILITQNKCCIYGCAGPCNVVWLFNGCSQELRVGIGYCRAEIRPREGMADDLVDVTYNVFNYTFSKLSVAGYTRGCLACVMHPLLGGKTLHVVVRFIGASRINIKVK